MKASIKSVLIAVILFGSLCCQSSFGQGIDVSAILKPQMIKYLNPFFQTNDTTQIVGFIIYPDGSHNSSLRILETKGKCYLEVRSLDKNIRLEVLKRIYEEKAVKSEALKGMTVIEMHVREKFDVSNLTIKTNLYSIPVSSSFKNNMLKAFIKVNDLCWNQQRLYINGKLRTDEQIDVFDGSTYEFRTYVDGKMANSFIQADEYDPYNTTPIDSADYVYQVKLANVRIINDLKNGTFKESNYDIYK
jgi:hypothetical protein